MRRREFLSHLGAGSALAFLPAFTRDAFAANASDDSLIISEVEVLKLSGTHELVPGLDRQFQVNPLHLYEERRPKPFKDPPPGTKTERRPLTHYYVRIRTKGGTEGIYGAVDKEALPVLLGNLGRWSSGSTRWPSSASGTRCTARTATRAPATT